MAWNGILSGMNEQRASNDQSGLANLQQASGLTSLLQNLQKQQQEQQMRGALAQSGGDPEAAMKISLQTGNIDAASKLAPLVKQAREAKMTEQFTGMGQMTPDQLDLLGQRLAVSGHPGAAMVMSTADKRRALERDRASITSMQSELGQAPVGLQAGQSVPGVSGGQLVQDVPAGDMAAFLKVAQSRSPMSATVQPQDALPQRTGGALGFLVNNPDPSISGSAKALQARIDAGGGGMTQQQVQSHIDNLTRMAVAREGAQIARDQRPDRLIPVEQDGKTVYMPESQAVGLNVGAKSTAGGAGSLGNRESVFINRVVLSGNEAAKDLANVVKMPLTTSSGVFGTRGHQVGMMNAGVETLANTMTTQEVQSYNVLATGFQRSLAAIESAGLAPSGRLSGQMDAVIFKQGDTNFTKLQKLAQTRQIVEAGLETIVANPRVPEETRNHIKSIIANIEKSVPFTNSDLIDLQQAQRLNPNATLADVIKAQKGAPAATGGWSIRPK